MLGNKIWNGKWEDPPMQENGTPKNFRGDFGAQFTAWNRCFVPLIDDLSKINRVNR